MNFVRLNRFLVPVLIAATTLLAPFIFFAAPAPQTPPNIRINGFLASDKAQRGRPIRAAVVLEIPDGFHVNSNKPLASYLIATELKFEAPKGVRVGPVTYPRALLRTFKFSKDKLSVYEGRAIMRFNVTVPANFDSGSAQVKARLRYQSCNEELCFPPQTREVTIPIQIVGANESVKRVNQEYFGSTRRR